MNPLFIPSVGACRSAQHRDDQQGQPAAEENEHGCDHELGSPRRTFGFFPDEDSPDGGDHRPALSEAVGDRGARHLRGNEVRGDANSIDHPTQNADRMIIQCSAAEVLRVRDPWALDWMRHQIGVEEKVRNKRSGAIHQHGSIRPELSRS